MEAKIVDLVYAQVGISGVLLVVLVVAFWNLHTSLTKVRVEVAYQMNRDLLARRFAAYGQLWHRMHTSAVYTVSGFGPTEAKGFSESLSTWYFSPDGGLFLSRRAREFYFALQELLQSVGRLPGWRCEVRPLDPKTIFTAFMRELAEGDRNVAATMALLEKPEALDAEQWRASCRAIAKRLEAFVGESAPGAGEAIYAATQQVSSILRSNLAREIRSRLDVSWPAA